MSMTTADQFEQVLNLYDPDDRTSGYNFGLISPLEQVQQEKESVGDEEIKELDYFTVKRQPQQQREQEPQQQNRKNRYDIEPEVTEQQKAYLNSITPTAADNDEQRREIPNTKLGSPDYLPRSDLDFTLVEKRKFSLSSVFLHGGGKKVNVCVPEHNQGTASQQKKFSKLYTKAMRGNKVAQCELGVTYYYGAHGTMQSTKDALYWLNLSGVRNYIPAQVNLGIIYLLSQEFDEAISWFESAAELGSEWGMYHLGVMHFSGERADHQPNYALAFRYFKQCAKKGLTIGASNVGTMYYLGLGVEQNSKKAMKWFKKVSEFCCYADFNLALMYEEGFGTMKDPMRSDLHFELATNQFFLPALCPVVTQAQFAEKKPLMVLIHNF